MSGEVRAGAQAAPTPIPLRWSPREPPLAPVAVAAVSATAHRLAQRLLAQPARLEALQGVFGAEVILLLGEAADLPWIPGVEYLGVDPAAPGLMLPTHSRPSLHPRLLENALRLAFPLEAGPLAVLAEQRRVISVTTPVPLSDDLLLAWLPSTAADAGSDG